MRTVVVEAQLRESLGKKGSAAIRKAGNVPGIIYGGENVVHFSCSAKSLRPLIYTPEFKVAEIKVGEQSVSAIVKDIQFHPVTDELVHIDLIQLVPGKKVKMSVPLTLEGFPEGVKSGGKLIQSMRTVSITTTPENMVESVSLDVTSLGLGKSARIRDIQILEGVTLLNPAALPVAMVEIPRALRSAQSKAAAEEKED